MVARHDGSPARVWSDERLNSTASKVRTGRRSKTRQGFSDRRRKVFCLWSEIEAPLRNQHCEAVDAGLPVGADSPPRRWPLQNACLHPGRIERNFGAYGRSSLRDRSGCTAQNEMTAKDRD
jgi:hypothetical protein